MEEENYQLKTVQFYIFYSDLSIDNNLDVFWPWKFFVNKLSQFRRRKRLE